MAAWFRKPSKHRAGKYDARPVAAGETFFREPTGEYPKRSGEIQVENRKPPTEVFADAHDAFSAVEDSLAEEWSDRPFARQDPNAPNGVPISQDDISPSTGVGKAPSGYDQNSERGRLLILPVTRDVPSDTSGAIGQYFDADLDELDEELTEPSEKPPIPSDDKHEDAATKEMGRRGLWIERFSGRAVLLILLSLATVALLRLFVIRIIPVKDDSMQSVLSPGDRAIILLCETWWRDPERGDVALCFFPGSDAPYLRRIIALPGEMILIRNNTIYIDGREIVEPYASKDGADFGPIVVPDDSYFVLCDQRGDGRDSRFASIGALPASNIKGRSVLILSRRGLFFME